MPGQRPYFRPYPSWVPVRLRSIEQLRHEEVPRQPRRYPITLLCPDWQDPRNVGSIFRLADAAGLTEIVLAGTTPQPPHPKIAKTARSTERAIPYRHIPKALPFMQQAKRAGSQVVALEITSESQSLFDYVPPADRPLLLVAGTERSGIAADLLAEADLAVHLPMHGQNTSMNVAVAVGAAVYLLLMKLQ